MFTLISYYKNPKEDEKDGIKTSHKTLKDLRKCADNNFSDRHIQRVEAWSGETMLYSFKKDEIK